MKNQIIVAVLAVFVIILGIQTYMIFNLNEHLKLMQAGANVANPIPNLAKPLLPMPGKDDDFFNGKSWNPYEEMQRMQNEMEQIFGDSFSRFHLHSPLGSLTKSPDVDLREKSDHYIVTVNAPGADEPSINVDLDGQRLNISIKTEHNNDQAEDGKDSYRYRERFVGEFHRIITLPGPVDAANMKTEYRNGVLTVTIPKK